MASTKLNINSIKDKSIPKSKLNDSIFEDSYPEMTVGSATDLTGHNESSEQSFTFQPSAGDMSIKDESAYIKRIKGNSVVRNQLVKNADFRNGTEGWSTSNGTLSANNGVCKFISSGNSACFYTYFENYIPSNHKVLVMVDNQRASSDDSTFGIYLRRVGESNSDAYISNSFASNSRNTLCAFMTTTAPIERVLIYPTMNVGAGYETSIYSVSVIDLTKEFSAGNEPSTIEEFYARIPSGIDITAYNEGEIINLNTEAIKTVGFNQWDEQWEIGSLNLNNGEPSNNSTTIRSKNFIPVIGGETYNFHCTRTDISLYFRVVMYDANKKFIDVIPSGVYSSTSTANANYHNPWKFDSNVRYIKFDLTPAYGNVYNNDICINLSHTGYKDGTYEPHKEFTRELPVIKQYFQDGMKKAGDVCDSIEWDNSKQKWVAVQRVGVVDLGSFGWSYSTNSSVFFTNKLGATISGKTGVNCVTAKYDSYMWSNIAQDKTISIQIGYVDSGITSVMVRDSSYTDAATFKQAMSGVILNYELAEPIVTEIEEKYVNFDYYVEDFGTEEVISSVASAPFNADIIYQFNAVDRIRNNSLVIQNIKDTVLLKNNISEIEISEIDALVN